MQNKPTDCTKNLIPLSRPAVIVILAFSLLTPVVGLAIDEPAVNSASPGIFNTNFCSKTSMAAYSSCYNEGQEEYWIRWGSCTNVIDAEERNECFAENTAQRQEASEECLEQLEGRDEVCELVGEGRYDPDYAPEDFVDPAAIGDTVEPNPYFPLIPGSRWVYEGEDELIVVEVLDETKLIDGVLCAVVRDTVSEISEGEDEEDGENRLQDEGDDELAGELVEDTHDWYAQDTEGNVWYFGEIAVNYEDGEISDLDGSWKAGEDGARAGILVPIMPQLDQVYRQEFLLGEAEDVAQVVSLDAMPELGDDNPADCSNGCLQTAEWTPIEPDALEYKYYQPGVGLVQEADPESGETVELVEYSN